MNSVVMLDVRIGFIEYNHWMGA